MLTCWCEMERNGVARRWRQRWQLCGSVERCAVAVLAHASTTTGGWQLSWTLHVTIDAGDEEIFRHRKHYKSGGAPHRNGFESDNLEACVVYTPIVLIKPFAIQSQVLPGRRVRVRAATSGPHHRDSIQAEEQVCIRNLARPIQMVSVR